MVLRLSHGAEELPGGVEGLWGGVAKLPGGTEEFWAVIFLPVAAFRAVIFCPPRCSELRSVQWGHLFLAFVAFSASNAFPLSGICGIRYQKGPPTVRNMRAVLKKASYGTRRVF